MECGGGKCSGGGPSASVLSRPPSLQHKGSSHPTPKSTLTAPVTHPSHSPSPKERFSNWTCSSSASSSLHFYILLHSSKRLQRGNHRRSLCHLLPRALLPRVSRLCCQRILWTSLRWDLSDLPPAQHGLQCTDLNSRIVWVCWGLIYFFLVCWEFTLPRTCGTAQPWRFCCTC